MKRLSLLFIAILLLGCTGLQNGVDPVSSAKSLDAIQVFLGDHPNAKIVSQYLTQDKAVQVLKKYSECDLVDAQPMYYVTFKDDQLTAAAFISIRQEPLCIVTAPQTTSSATTTPTVKPTEKPTATPKPGIISGACAPEGTALTDAINPVGPTDYVECCAGLKPYPGRGEAGICLKPEDAPTPTPQNTPTPTPTPPVVSTSAPKVKPYVYNADLPDSTALKAADLKALFGCTDVVHDLDSSRWLEPKLPIARCQYEFSQKAQETCNYGDAGFNDCFAKSYAEQNAQFNAQGGLIRQGGYDMDVRTRYVVFVNGAPKLITTDAEFREVFGPVDSPAEAIAFADLLNDFIGLKVDLKADFVREYGEYEPDSYDYVVSEIHGTHAEATEGGYLVNLFDTFPGGCTTGIFQVNLVVKSDGSLTKKPPSPQVASETRVALPDVRMEVEIASRPKYAPIACA